MTPKLLTTSKMGLSSLLLSTALTACTVGPDYTPPKAELVPFHNAAYTSPTQGHTAPPLDHWWTGFNDPMLVTVVQRALNENLDLDAAFATDRDSAPSNYAMPDAPTQPVDALRHDFIADAHRAKLKAAAKIDTRLDPNLGRTGEMSAERGSAVQKPRKRRGIFRSPRLADQ